MEQYEYAYTRGLDEAAVDERLRTHETGVLSLADGNDGYAIPMAYHWDGERFYFRLADHPGSEKMAFLEATERASFVVYHYTTPDDSWSVLASGRLRVVPDDEAGTLTERDDFLPLRLFGENVSDVDPVIYALDVETLSGRST